MVIGQVAADDEDGEIIAARTLLGLPDLDGAPVTGDALHRRAGAARVIRERGGDRLFTKAERPARRAEAAASFRSCCKGDRGGLGARRDT